MKKSENEPSIYIYVKENNITEVNEQVTWTSKQQTTFFSFNSSKCHVIRKKIIYWHNELINIKAFCSSSNC